MVTQTPLNIINVFPSEASYESNKGSLGENEISLVSGVGVVLESYTSDTSWYRKWSDGWIEQGGHATGVSNGFTTQVLLKPFANINYSVHVTGYTSRTSADYNACVKTDSKTTTQFQFIRDDYEDGGVDWYAVGLGA